MYDRGFSDIIKPHNEIGLFFFLFRKYFELINISIVWSKTNILLIQVLKVPLPSSSKTVL